MLRFVEQIAVVGCGGIGSWLLGPLLRLLEARRFEGEVHLWDGDRYSPANRDRQAFSPESVGHFKAEAQADV